MQDVMAPPVAAEDLDIPVAIVTDLIYRLLFHEGAVALSRMAEVLGLQAQLLDGLMARMQREHLVEVSGTGSLGRLSFSYTLSEAGMARARDALERSQYLGRAPVSLESYRRAILAQTAQRVRLTPKHVKEALRFLVLPDNFHRRIGPAVGAGSSLFLYGPPGNGKTTVAQLIGEMLGAADSIYLPHALTIGGQIVQIIDPQVHIPWTGDSPAAGGAPSNGSDPPAKPSLNGSYRYDRRWSLFQRPAVMVGGELKMDALDLRFEPVAKFYEAPLQLKANGGMFLIDDFGRQRIRPDELLNRWIVPLESGIDFLRLQSGQTLEVPFRQLIVFCTNLDPSKLVDGAFMRRIHMKVEVGGPDERQFYEIFTAVCLAYKIQFDKECFIHLVKKWYRQTGREMQAVHPRDIIKTIVAICEYEGVPPRLTPELIDEACASYFVNSSTYGRLRPRRPAGGIHSAPIRSRTSSP
jgi:predicted ATPase with chaperone activity